MDATARGAIVAAVRADLGNLSGAGALTGAEVDLDARAQGPRTLYLAALHGAYTRLFDLAGASIPEQDVDAELTASASFTVSPRAELTLGIDASLATTLGIRADTDLLMIDPFTFGQRLEYATGFDLDYTLQTSARGSVDLAGGFTQAGAVAADVPAAVGVDSNAVHAEASYDHEVAPKTSLGPDLAYDFTHYRHELYDVWLHRGPADVHAGTLAMAASRDVTAGLRLSGSSGVTVATPMPILKLHRPMVAPEFGVRAAYTGKRWRLTARYGYAYTSLGPRLGQGQEHQALVKLAAQPFDGGSRRDVWLEGTLRFHHGGAPVGADPPLFDGITRPVPAQGTITATRLSAGLKLEVPLAKGLAFTSGVDLELARGSLSGAPPAALILSPRASQAQLLVSLGLAATASTDPARRARRDPAADADVASRRADRQEAR